MVWCCNTDNISNVLVVVILSLCSFGTHIKCVHLIHTRTAWLGLRRTFVIFALSLSLPSPFDFHFQLIDRLYRIHINGRDAKLPNKYSWNVDDSISSLFFFCLFATPDYYVGYVILISLLSTRSAWFNSIKFQFNTFTVYKYISCIVCMCVFRFRFLAFTFASENIYYHTNINR